MWFLITLSLVCVSTTLIIGAYADKLARKLKESEIALDEVDRFLVPKYKKEIKELRENLFREEEVIKTHFTVNHQLREQLDEKTKALERFETIREDLQHEYEVKLGEREREYAKICDETIDEIKKELEKLYEEKITKGYDEAYKIIKDREAEIKELEKELKEAKEKLGGVPKYLPL